MKNQRSELLSDVPTGALPAAELGLHPSDLESLSLENSPWVAVPSVVTWTGEKLP